MDGVGLKRDELLYELRLRRAVGTDFMNLTLLRSAYASLASESVDMNFPEITLDVAAELEICSLKYAELKILVEQFAGNVNGEEYDILDCRILHILNRSRRLINRASETQRTLVEQLLSQIFELDERLNSHSLNALSATLPLNHTATISEVPPSSGNRVVPPHKWNVSFDGSQPVNEFLLRIEELRIARQCSKETLFKSAVDIFSGDALVWFRMIQSQGVCDWDSLVAALRAHFLPTDSDFEITQKIFSRTQLPNEKIILFMANLHGLIQQLSTPLPDHQLITIIKRNILPYYGPYLVTEHFDSVKDLSDFLVLMEPTILRNKAALTCSGAHVATNRRSVSSRPVNNNAVVSAVPLMCWNCSQPGHRFSQCAVTRSRFCYRCGDRSHLANSCPQEARKPAASSENPNGEKH